MSKQMVKSPMGQTQIIDGQVEASTDDKHPADVLRRIYRRRPLLVSGRQLADGSWEVVEAGRTTHVDAALFDELYEVCDVDGTTGGPVDVGLPDLLPGSVVERDGKKYVRVIVHAGRGSTAYWQGMVPHGQDCGWRVTADMIDNEQASHRVGRFVEPFEGKPGVRTWVEVGK